MERAYDDAKYGRYSRKPYIDMVIPSLTDPSVAPPGKHVLSCFVQYAPFKLKEGSFANYAIAWVLSVRELSISVSASAFEIFNFGNCGDYAIFIGAHSQVCHLMAEAAGPYCDTASCIRRSGLLITQLGSSSDTSSRPHCRSEL